jgi:hypothetical protein
MFNKIRIGRIGLVGDGRADDAAALEQGVTLEGIRRTA